MKELIDKEKINKLPINSNLISILIFILSAYLFGLSFIKVDMPYLSWFGIFLIPFALNFAKNSFFKIIGFLLFLLVSQFSGHPWYMYSVYLASNGMFSAPKLIFFSLLIVIISMNMPQLITFIIGIFITRKKHIPIFIWFPITYLLGEEFMSKFAGLSMGAWLYSQWKSGIILKLVSNLGWNLSILIFFVTILSLSESILLKNRYFYISILGILIILIQPDLDNKIPKILENIGVVYTDNETYRPKNVNSKIKLLIWPEQARSGRPRVREGDNINVKIKPPLKSNDIFHIIGMETRIIEGLQNSALLVSPEGNILSVRSKKSLFPTLEQPFYGLMFNNRFSYIEGKLPSFVEFKNNKIITLLCFEQMNRRIVFDIIKKNKIDLIAILARDSILGISEEVYNQFTGISVLLAVETGLPLVRSSVSGPAIIINPAGKLLSINEMNKSGILYLK